MKIKKYEINFKILLLLLISLLMNGCHSALLDPKGQIAMQERSLILTAFGLMLLVVIPAILMTILFAIKYRSTNTQSQYRPDWSHSSKLEILIWTIPICIIIFLALLSWKSTHTLEPSRPLNTHSKSIEIDVIALDWKWLFIYPKQRIATINEIVFPMNTQINFKVTSYSVMNSFFIPTLGSQIYAMAGMQTQLHLIANQPGIFDGISSNFSGRGFSGMKFKAIATKNVSEFNNWITKVRSTPNQLNHFEDFEKLALPSENNPVQYFNNVDATLFKKVIDKFLMCHHKNKGR